MPFTWIMKTIGVLVLSLLAGVFFYYVTSPLNHPQKKQQIEKVLSLIINFIIFIWLGKIVLNVPVFIKDPLAVLAYPSNAHAFYTAVLFLLINIGYRTWKHQFKLLDWMAAFVPMFLAASFTFEFFQYIDLGHELYLRQMIFLMCLLIVYLLMQGKISEIRSALLTITLWALGQFILSIIFPLATLFEYQMKPVFNLVLLLIFTALSFYEARVTGGRIPRT